MKIKKQNSINLDDYIVPPHDGISVYVNSGGTITIEGDDGTGMDMLISFHPRHASQICRAIRHAANLAAALAADKAIGLDCKHADHENTNN